MVKVGFKSVDTHQMVDVDALLDSSATGVFMDKKFTERNGIAMCHRITLCNYITLPYTFLSYASTMPRCSSVSTLERSMQDDEELVPHRKLPLLIKDQ